MRQGERVLLVHRPVDGLFHTATAFSGYVGHFLKPLSDRDTTAQQLRQKCVARRGEGARLVGKLFALQEKRLNKFIKALSDTAFERHLSGLSSGVSIRRNSGGTSIGQECCFTLR